MSRPALLQKHAVTLAFVSLVLLSVLTLGLRRPTPRADGAEAVRWDYRAVSLTRDLLGPKEGVPKRDERSELVELEKALVALGDEGWELVQGDGDLFLFKRPRGAVLRTMR